MKIKPNLLDLTPPPKGTPLSTTSRRNTIAVIWIGAVGILCGQHEVLAFCVDKNIWHQADNVKGMRHVYMWEREMGASLQNPWNQPLAGPEFTRMLFSFLLLTVTSIVKEIKE